MNLSGYSRKETGALGEKVAAHYLTRHGFRILERNLTRKLGELDIVARKGEAIHFVEVKSILVRELPVNRSALDTYDPTVNLHPQKIRKVARMGQWYLAEKGWEGEWQVDGVLVWLRELDGVAHVRYLPQIF